MPHVHTSIYMQNEVLILDKLIKPTRFVFDIFLSHLFFMVIPCLYQLVKARVP